MTQPPPHVALANHKGGVGKTGMTQGLAVAAAELGDRVLVVDMDAQSNATRRLRAPVSDDPDVRAKNSLADVLQRPAPGEIERILVPCGYGGVYSERITVAPGHLDLELLPRTAAQAQSERRLLRALHGVTEDFDLVLIDCPPNLLSHQIDNAWTATDVILIPLEPEHDGVQAARRIVERVEMERDTLNPDLAVGGIVINRFRENLTVHQQRYSDAQEILGPDAVCPTKLSELVAFKNMGENALPIAECDARGKAAAPLFHDIYRWTRARVRAVMEGATS